jgi:hypothetical protein
MMMHGLANVKFLDRFKKKNVNAKFQENLPSCGLVFMKVLVALGDFACAPQTYTLRNGSKK